MKTDISYLPAHKQAELSEIVAAIRKTVPTQMIILFGSYARNSWIEDWYDETHFRYLSDYDLLVIIENKSEAYQSKYESAIASKIRTMENIKTPVSAIVHDIEFFNRRLRKGQYFFCDIKKEGVLLYTSNKYQLDEPRELHPNERKKLAQDSFSFYFENAINLYDHFQIALNKKDFRNAAFFLHQVTEKLYSGILLVYTHYKPNTHNIEMLRKLTNSLDNQFLMVFPLYDSEDRRLFELLRRAYVDARYNPNYVITLEELTQLAKKVEKLRDLGTALCKAKIDSFI